MRPAQAAQRARHGGDAHPLALRLFPPGAPLFQGSIGIGFELGRQRILSALPDVPLCARDGFGDQGAALELLLEVPLDGTDANAKDPRGLPL